MNDEERIRRDLMLTVTINARNFESSEEICRNRKDGRKKERRLLLLIERADLWNWLPRELANAKFSWAVGKIGKLHGREIH